MKSLNLMLDDTIFDEATEISAELHVSRNSYINEAIYRYNLLNNSVLLKKKLAKESKLTSKDSKLMLKEFES